MGKMSEKFKVIWEKWKAFSMVKKMSFGILFTVVIVALVTLSLYATSTKYGVLFSNMDPTDAQTVLSKLNQLKVTNKVQGSSILVPVDQVDNLRLQLAPDITNGTKGFELFDNTSQFGMTDQQMSIEYQRALEGELERTIQGFPQVAGARVHLVLPDNSAFVTDSSAASASVTLQLKSGTDLTKDQVKAMVALMTGAVKNLPKENVQIIDDKMRLLTDNLYTSTDASGNSTDVSADTENQQQLKSAYEQQLEQKVLALVQPLAANGDVKVKINADMDFNAVSSDSVVVDPTHSTVVSQHIITNTSNSGNGQTTTAQSPQNANANPTSTTYPNTTQTGNAGTSTNTDNTVNYDTSKTETKTIQAPGKVTRLTASVIFNGTLSAADKQQIQDIVSNAIGYDPSRNDSITIAAMKFDTTSQSNVKNDIAAINTANQKAAQQKLYEELGIGIGALIVLGVLGLTLRKRSDAAKGDILDGKPSLNMVIGDEIKPKDIKPSIIFDPIDFEPNNEKLHVENEIRKYAKEKPEQVSDIIKAWLAEDER